MEYVVVLQWSSHAPKTDFEELVRIEERLREFEESFTVDGHDIGSGEMNIFLFTEDPDRAFHQIESALKTDTSWSTVRIGYRRIDEDHYVPLWPASLDIFKVL